MKKEDSNESSFWLLGVLYPSVRLRLSQDDSPELLNFVSFEECALVAIAPPENSFLIFRDPIAIKMASILIVFECRLLAPHSPFAAL